MLRSRLLVALTLLLALFAVACSKAKKTTPDVVVFDRPAVTIDPFDRAWNDIPKHVAPLLLQDMVDPRLMEPSTNSRFPSGTLPGGRFRPPVAPTSASTHGC